ncbi:uncharacterized protein LOC125211335 [Salvia hispanica]|uniref:uncharacterized protein LOC125211335 n=1 Tax=Salvia hispanica TaxID=49212 RepID=UPI0020096542|nr:uncharacterized protein LOC125211335 [Salvia hispanica]
MVVCLSRMPTSASVRSINYISAQVFSRKAKAAKKNTRIDGAPPTRKKLIKPYKALSLCETLGSHGIPDPYISETNCAPCLQHWEADICPNPNPKPHIFVNYHDNEQYFAAHSLAEDGTISPNITYILHLF